MVRCACAVEVWLNGQLAVVVFMTTRREKLSSGDTGTVSKLPRQAAKSCCGSCTVNRPMLCFELTICNHRGRVHVTH